MSHLNFQLLRERACSTLDVSKSLLHLVIDMTTTRVFVFWQIILMYVVGSCCWNKGTLSFCLCWRSKMYQPPVCSLLNLRQYILVRGFRRPGRCFLTFERETDLKGIWVSFQMPNNDNFPKAALQGYSPAEWQPMMPHSKCLYIVLYWYIYIEIYIDIFHSCKAGFIPNTITSYEWSYFFKLVNSFFHTCWLDFHLSSILSEDEKYLGYVVLLG